MVTNSISHKFAMYCFFVIKIQIFCPPPPNPQL